MTTLILNSSMDQLVFQLCKWRGVDFISSYLPFALVGVGSDNYNPNTLLGWTRYKLTSLGDLEGILNSGSGDIFAEESEAPQNLLIDYQDLELNSECLELVNKYQEGQASSDIPSLILYSLNSDTSTAISKLFGTSSNIELIDYKLIPKDKSTKDVYAQSLSQLTSEYSARLNLSITLMQLNQITASSSTYREIIDHLDFLSLTGEPSQYIGELIIPEKPILFMQAFGPRMSQPTINIWKNIPEADMQLSLSLAYTKLAKAGEKDLIRDLIETDLQVKTTSKVTPLTLWKYLLWRVVS